MGAGQPAPGLPPGTSKVPRKRRREEQRRATGAQHLPHHCLHPPASPSGEEEDARRKGKRKQLGGGGQSVPSKSCSPSRAPSPPDLAEGALEANPPISAGASRAIPSPRQAPFLMALWGRPGLPFHLYLLPAPLSSTASPYDIPLNYLDW